MKHGIVDDEQAIDQWLNSKRSAGTREQYLLTVGAWRRSNRTPLVEVTIDDLQRWQASISEKSPATVRREVSTIKSLFKYLNRVGYLKENVAAILEPPPIKHTLAERILTEDQVETLIRAAEGNLRDYTLVRLLYLTGARASEAASVTWKDFSEKNGGAEVTIFGKAGKTRKVLIGEALWIDISQLRDGAKLKDRVFGLQDGKAVLRVVKNVAKVAGMPNVTPHFLRHSIATHALMNGMKLPDVSAGLGHADWKTTQKYVHLTKEQSFGEFVKVG